MDKKNVGTLRVTVHCKHTSQSYDGIVRVHIDDHGNLRLFRKPGRWRKTPDIFHPAFEWYGIQKERVS
jgi:hypothetical protein